jgi:hypothetical protein
MLNKDDYESVALSIAGAVADDIEVNAECQIASGDETEISEDTPDVHAAVNVERSQEKEDAGTPKESSIDLTKTYITKYDNVAIIIFVLTCLFLVSWTLWMFYNFSKLDGDEPLQIMPRVLIQILLIVLIVIQMYMLIKSGRTGGVTLYEPKPAEHEEAIEKAGKLKQIINKVKALKKFYETHRINVRKLVHSEKETPQETAIEFLFSSFIMLAVFKLVAHSPTIIINLCTSEFDTSSDLFAAGMALLLSDLTNILQTLYAKYCCCCNPCRRRCCWYDGCCCDCCCRYINGQCCYETHFPPHHLPYVNSTQLIMMFSSGLKLAAAIKQILAFGDIYIAYQVNEHLSELRERYAAMGYPDLIPEMDASPLTGWRIWWTCFNFLLGVWAIIGVLRINWRYYYLLYFYWSRMAVNKHENHKIIETLRGVLKGVYGVCYIQIDEEQDEFARVDGTESIADRVELKWDCFTLWYILLPSLAMCIAVAYYLFIGIEMLNDMTY